MLDIKNQHGAVMLLVAMLASTLLLLAGLAIDSSVIANSKIQQRHAAEYMALGSLKAFNKETSSDKTVKLTTATTRAQQLAQENHFLAKNFLVNNSPESIGNNLPSSSGSHGKITPGIWYFEEGTGICNGTDPDTGSPISDRPAPCPCDASDNSKWSAPCFRELNYSAGSSDLNLTPNAMRVELKTASNSPIRTLFAKVKGQEYISISSSATAVQVPRRAVFLVDLSRHSHNETHIPYQAASSPTPTSYSTQGEFGSALFSGEYDFRLLATTCPADNSNPCATSRGQPSTCTFSEGNTVNLFDTLYYFLKPGFPPLRILNSLRPTTLQLPTKHYKSDYQCFNTLNYSDQLPDLDLSDSVPPPAATTLTSESYLIDTYHGQTSVPGQTYDGAEPLNTMLAGVNNALNKFRDTKLPADEMTVIGFDGSASIDIRTLGPTPIDASNTTFQDIENLSDLSFADPTNANNAVYKTSRFENHLFFPRVEAIGMDKQKNIPEALIRAKEFLISAGNQTSENFVVLISDGISSCYLSDLPADCGAASVCRICSNSYAGFMNSIQQAEKIITEDYIPNNIKFHFVQIGLRSRPHLLQRVKEEGTTKTCMSVEDMEKADPPEDTIDPTFLDSSTGLSIESGLSAEDEFKRITYGETSFPLATDFGRLAKLTKGEYMPIRQCCQSGGACADVTAALNAECDNLALSNGDTVDGSYSDDRGRITCDSLGRDRRTQMQDSIAEVFNVDPYIIVD